jgi:hypothetical protein
MEEVQMMGNSWIQEKINRNLFAKNFTGPHLDFPADIGFRNKSGSLFKLPASLSAGTAGTWTFRIENVHGNIQAGADFHIMCINYNFPGKLQTINPKGINYTTIRNNSGAELLLACNTRGFHNLCKIVVTSGTFRKGESFTVVIGDTKHGSPGTAVYWTATEGQFIIGADLTGTGEYSHLTGSPWDVTVKAHGTPALFRLLGPTAAGVDEKFDMHLGVFDRHGNIIEGYEGKVEINPIPETNNLPPECHFTPAEQGNLILRDVSFSREGVYRLSVTVEDLPRGAETFWGNPIIIENGYQEKIGWGDIHAHSWGDETMHLMHLRNSKVDPLKRHLQAREIGRLDFSAIGPMSFPETGRETIWEAYKAACKKTEQDGKYVPFPAYEAHPAEGDRNVIFNNIDEELPPGRYTPLEQVESRYGNRKDVLIEGHIGGQRPKWELYRPQKEPLIEVASAFGNAEWLLNKALSLGYKPAVCGCSDLHLGLMGGPRAVEPARGRFSRERRPFGIFNRRDSAYGTGPLTAVLTEKINRNSIWDGLRKKRTYATSGARMFLDIRLNGAFMGSDVEVKDHNDITIRCYGADMIEEVSLICGNHRIKHWEPKELDFQEKTEISKAELTGDWLYLRVKQKDGNYGWTSPFYFITEHPRWNHTEIDLDRVRNKEAEKHLPQLEEYLRNEEDISLLHNITPAGIVKQETTEYALFYCLFRGYEPMSIRWFYRYEIPLIRYDWGFEDIGVREDETAYGFCSMEDTGEK